MKFNIRKAKASDVPAMMQLVLELAEYEKAIHEVSNTEEKMLADGFGDQPLFYAIVAEKEGLIVGLSIYYFRYSTWKGKRIYLEDIVVTEAQRGQGIGKALFEATIAAGKEANCTGMMWQVLEWNEPAINFYKKYEARLDPEWLNAHLEFNS